MDPLLCVSHLLFFNPAGTISVAEIYAAWDNAAAARPGGLELKATLGAHSPLSRVQGGCPGSPQLPELVPEMPAAGWTNPEPFPPRCHLLREPHVWVWSRSVFISQRFPGEVDREGLEMAVQRDGDSAGSYGEGDTSIWRVLRAERGPPDLHRTGLSLPKTCRFGARQAKTWLFRGCQSNVMHLSVTTATSARSF